MSPRTLPLLVAVAVAGSAWFGGIRNATGAEGLAALVAEGERWWMKSPDPANPVACATCHFDPALVRGWAASFPKVRPLPPPASRVMTLLQANAEAVGLHYRLADPRPVATAITAYLNALGSDVPVSPGVSAGQPVFPDRIQDLRRSVQRGRSLFAGRCRGCHAAEGERPRAAPGRGGRSGSPPEGAAARVPELRAVAAIVRTATAFPRVVDGRVESLESFLERHEPVGLPLAWDGQATADVVAYLMSRVAGRGPRAGRPGP